MQTPHPDSQPLPCPLASSPSPPHMYPPGPDPPDQLKFSESRKHSHLCTFSVLFPHPSAMPSPSVPSKGPLSHNPAQMTPPAFPRRKVHLCVSIAPCKHLYPSLSWSLNTVINYILLIPAHDKNHILSILVSLPCLLHSRFSENVHPFSLHRLKIFSYHSLSSYWMPA